MALPTRQSYDSHPCMRVAHIHPSDCVYECTYVSTVIYELSIYMQELLYFVYFSYPERILSWTRFGLIQTEPSRCLRLGSCTCSRNHGENPKASEAPRDAHPIWEHVGGTMLVKSKEILWPTPFSWTAFQTSPLSWTPGPDHLPPTPPPF